MNHSGALSPNGTSQDDHSAAASFAHSLSVAPLDSASTLHSISLALNGSSYVKDETHHDTDILMMDATTASADSSSFHFQQPESRMAVAELLVSLGQSSRGNEPYLQNDHQSTMMDSGAGSSQQTPSYRAAADYVGSVKKAYESNPKVYTEFLGALEKYHEMSLTIEQLVRTVMALFQDQPDLLMGFKDFLPEAQGLLNQLVPVTYQAISIVGAEETSQQEITDHDPSNNGHAAADFLSLIKERSQQEPDMYQHLITLLRKFQKDHSYSTLYFYVSIILRYHPHLLQRFHKFLPTVTSGVEVTEPRVISKAPPEELVISPDFIDAKDFVQTVKYEAKNDMSMYDRFISALEKYQRTGWTIDQVYSEVSLIFWNHPEALAGFKLFITTVPQQP
ncbi:hypothetical protein BGZ95_008094 [Linnemannia exigua]|uniref:Paired amphipathic helix protein Sin3a n=1 Tax=Linnemannia exigua TaxID=604196 RepID=A0AAD4DG71_9FUNG|nr:hypothetical protein BGZ95_008094 [Linnemannia exigua]